MHRITKKTIGVLLAANMFFSVASGIPFLKKNIFTPELVAEAVLFDIENYTSAYSICYQAHVQDRGWMNIVTSDSVAGTTGESRRLEAFRIYTPGIAYAARYADDGSFTGWKKNGEICGSTGQSRALECIHLYLYAPELRENYDLYYRVHIQDKGWLGWTESTHSAGNGYGARIEAIQIKMLKKGAYHFKPFGPAYLAEP